MTAGALIIIAFVVCALVIGTARARRQRQVRYEQGERTAMPPAIAQGCLVMSEQALASPYPRPLRARFDQVYAHAGELVPVETKTRRAPRWTTYDQIELSVQASILRHAPPEAWVGHRTARHGWIRFKCPAGTPVYRRVPLLTDEQVAALHDRFHQIVAGRITPRRARHAGVCRKCAYRSTCPRPHRTGPR